MTTVTLRPDGTTTAGTVTGAASTHAALNDNSDASYVQSISGSFVVSLSSFTLPAGAVVKAIQARTRGSGLGTRPLRQMNIRRADGTQVAFVTPVSGVTITTESGGYTTAFVSGVQTQAAVDALYATHVFGDTINERTHELYADVMYVTQPVTTVAAVAPDPYTASNLVPIAWSTTSDADGGAVVLRHVRVFSLAQYSIGGFDALTSPATSDSGVQWSSSTTLNTSALPSGTTYRAYVRTGQYINGLDHWSAWAFDQFVVTVTTSDVTSVTTVATNSTGSIAVTVNRTAISSAWDFVEVQRSIDAGVTWSNVRGATYVDPPLADSFVITDYEVPNGTSVTYRARATRIVSGLQITGAWTSSSSTSWTSTSTFLKVPGTSSLNISTLCLVSRTPYQRTRRTGVFQVLGKATPVTVSDVRSSRSGRLDLETLTTAEAASLNNMLNGASVILVQFPAVMDIADTYAAITDDANVFDAMVANVVRRTWSLDYVEVDAPADPLAGA